MTINQARQELKRASRKKQAQILQGFFKTGKGEYGEGEVFIGVKVPQTRKIALKYRDLPLKDTLQLLKSNIHEERLLALLIMVDQFKSCDETTRETIYKKYLANTGFIYNWDLINQTAPAIIGGFWASRAKKPLLALARSKDLWKRRISILSTFSFIRNGNFTETLKLSRVLLKYDHDLIHKAVGWMLREVGKRDISVCEDFLKCCYRSMPRTMLRYAIERFPEGKRLKYLHVQI